MFTSENIKENFNKALDAYFELENQPVNRGDTLLKVENVIYLYNLLRKETKYVALDIGLKQEGYERVIETEEDEIDAHACDYHYYNPKDIGFNLIDKRYWDKARDEAMEVYNRIGLIKFAEMLNVKIKKI
jgi:hypothetical protein